MKRIKHQILKKSIQSGSLVSLTSQNWYDNNGNLTPWSGSVYIGPNIGDGLYNFTGSVDEGYYKWGGSTWMSTSLTGVSENYNLPIFLESSADEMGVMVPFDGDIEQVEQFCNFTYKGNGNVITVYNTTNTNKLKDLVNAIFRISWGDGTSNTLAMPTVYDTNLPYVSHTYSSSGVKTIEVTVDSPWRVNKVKKQVEVPFTSSYGIPTDLGTLSFTVPYSVPLITGRTQNYLQDFTTLTGQTENTDIYFMAIGKSRIDEVRKYGSVNAYSGLTITPNYTGYSINSLYYMDYEGGYTHITGTTASYQNEEVYQGMVTRNEHLLGFIDEPQIFSDIFVERGKQGIMERNLRLGEMDSVGEISVYGSGYFNVKKQ